MNKRQLKKRERQLEREHEHELEKTAWGRIALRYEELQDALGAFVSTVIGEAATLGKEARQGLLAQVKSVDQEVAPRVAKVPLVGPAVARSIHQVIESAS